jgi:hypothetical protein
MQHGSTWFLRGVIVAMAIIALAICIFALPAINTSGHEEYPNIVPLLYLFIGGLYLAAVPFFIALYQGLRLLSHIDKNIAFSDNSVNALKYIKYCAIAMSVLFASGIPVLFQIAQIDDAPGLGLIALAFTGSPLVVATFAAVLEKLLRNGMEIKSENELTV